jgi:cell filamentation protein
MAYSISSTSDDCYPGMTVLVNKMDIREQTALDAAEEVASSVHAMEILQEAPIEPYTFSFYCSLHRRLFGDVYRWAGQVRTIDISKKGTTFCPAADLPELGEKLFQRLAALNEFRDLPKAQFVDEVAEFYHDLNMLHPFREGNGRTQRLFFTLLIERAGYSIHFDEHDPDDLMVATIFAAQGVMDYLKAYFERAIS